MTCFSVKKDTSNILYNKYLIIFSVLSQMFRKSKKDNLFKIAEKINTLRNLSATSESSSLNGG